MAGSGQRFQVRLSWLAVQSKYSNFYSTNAITQLKSLGIGSDQPKLNETTKGKKRLLKPNIPDCCICSCILISLRYYLSICKQGLFAVTIRQALFIAPCSHAFHYKCIKPLLEKHTSAFSCPLCRSFADLEEDVEVEADQELEEGDTDDDNSGSTPGVNRDREDPGGAWDDCIRPPVSAPVQSTNTSSQLAISSNSVQRNRLTPPHPPQPRDGAETEVETDMVQSHQPHRTRRPRVTVRTEGHIAVPSMPVSAPVLGHQTVHLPLQLPLPRLPQPRDADEEMIDGDLEDGDLYADEADVDAYVRGADPFNPEHAGNPSAAAAARDDLSEGEGSRSGSAEGALGLGLPLGFGMFIERGHDAEATVSGGKRKR